MKNLKKLRITSDRLNSYLGQLLDPRMGTKISYYTEPNNAIIYVNLYDFLQSQISNNLHRMFYQVDTTIFKKAAKYLSAVCEDTVYQNDEECKQAFFVACKIFIQDMAALQIVLSSSFVEVYVEPTVPLIFRQKFESCQEFSDADSLLSHSGEIVFADTFDMFKPLLAGNKEEIRKALQQLMVLGPVVYGNIDTRNVLLTAFSGETTAIDHMLVRLHLLSKDIINFGGAYD